MDEVVGKTVVRVGMDYSEIKQGITNLNAQMKVADATWKSSLSTFKQSDRSFEKLSTSIKGMSDKLRVQEQIVEAHKVNVSKLTKEYGANSTKVLNATANLKKQEGIYGNLKRSINEMNNEIAENNAKLKESSIQQRIVTGQQEKMIKQSQMLEKQQASMTSKLKLADQEWKNNVTSLGNVYKAVDKAKVNLDGLNKKYDIQKKIVIEHAQELRKLSSTYGDTDERVVQANIKLKEQIGIFKDMKNDITNVTKELNELKRAEQLNNSPWTQRSKELQAYSDKMNAIGDKMTNIGQNMTMSVTAPVALGMGFAIKKSMEFETSMSEVQALTNATGKDFERLKQYAIELGESTAFSGKEAADGMAVLGQAGFKTNQIIDAMPGLLDLAAASKMSLADSADIVVSSLNSFQIEASKAGHATDVLTKAGAETNASLGDMGEAMKYVGPVANDLGLSLEDTAGAIGILSNYGIKGSMAGTSLRMGLSKLNAPIPKVAKSMKELGINLHDSNGQMLSMGDLIKSLQEGTEKMTKSERAAYITRLVGMDAQSAWLKLLNQSPEKVDNFTKSLESSNGYAKDFAKTMRDNLSGDWDNFTGGLETFASKVYDDFTPALRGIVKAGDALVQTISASPKPVRMLATSLAIGAAATGPVILGFGMVAKAAGTSAEMVSKLTGKMAANTLAAETNAAANIATGTTIGKQGKLLGGVTGLFTKFGKASGGAATSTGLLARAGGLLTSGLRLLTGPVGIALTAVTALYGGFKLAYKHVDWFKTGVDNTGKLLKEVAGSINFQWAKDMGTTFKIGAGYARGLVGSLGDVIKKGVEMAPGTQMIKMGFGVINDAVSKATDKVDIYGKGVSRGAEKALKGYTDLSMKARLQLEKLRASHKTIGDKQYQEMVSLYDKMTNTALTKIEQRRSREMSGLRKLFSETKGLKASEENKILTEAQAGNNKEVQAVKSIQKQISAIYTKAHKEKRALTNIEESKLVVLQQRMDQKVVSSLSKSEKEQRIILGRLRDNKKALSIQAASEVIKASAKERDKTISDAKKKKKGIIDEAIYQRDVTKKISKDQADKIIKDAERQYKGSVKNAKEQHKKVVDEAARQNKGVKREIDSQTGHVLSKWQKLKRQTGPILTGIKVATVKSYEDAKKGVAKWIGQTASDTLKRWNGIKKSTLGVTESIRKTTVKKYEDLKSGTVKWLGVASTQMSSKWGSIKKNTTSLAEGVRKVAVDKFEQMYKKSTEWVNKIGTFISGAKKGISDKASDLGKGVANAAIGGLNAMISGINSIAKGITGKGNLISKIPDVVKKSTGGGVKEDTLAIVGDKGPGNGPGGFTREIIKRKDGSMHLTPAKDTLVYLGKEDEVINGRTTYNMMQNGEIPRYSTGVGSTKLGKSAEKKKKPSAAEVAGKFLGKMAGTTINNATSLFDSDNTLKVVKKTSEVGDKVKDFGEEIFEYMDNPGKLVDLVVGPLKSKFVGIGGATGEIALGAFNNIKSKLVKTVEGWFSEFGGGGDADGSSFTSFPVNTIYSPNARPPGYPYPAFHYGIDYGTPQGHPITAPTSGMLSQTFDTHGGLVGLLTDKIYTQFFMHMESLRKSGPIKKGEFLGKTGGARGLRNSGIWSTGPHLHYQVRRNGPGGWNTNTMNPATFLSQVGYGKGSGPSGVSGNASSWAPAIRRAAAQMKEKITNADVNAIIAQIHRESGGNQTIVQGNIGDINNRNGTPARGLLQYVPTTFANYMVKGHTNINSGYDQLLAFFNNKNWRANNPAGRSGWSPNGARKYADGGIINKPHFGLVGEAGEEVIIPTSKNKIKQAQPLLAYATNVLNKHLGNRNYVKEPPKTHTVKSGDTLWGISQANKMTVSMLKQLNNLKSNLIFPKQILKLNTGAYKLVGAIKEHATAIKQSITKKPATVKPKVQMTSITGVVSKFADGLIRTGTIFKDLKTSKTDLSFGKFLESKLKGLNSSNIKTVMTNISDIKKKLTEIDKKNEKLIKTNNTKIKSATVKNFDEQLKIDNYKAEKALNGKKGTITVKTRIAARDTTLIDRNLAKSKLNKAAHEKDLKTLHAYEDNLLKKRATLKTKKEKENNAKLLASTKKRIADEQKQRDKEVANIKKYEAQRADALKLKYKTEKKYVTGRSASALDKLINTSTNNIGKNNTLIKNLKSENALYAKQSATLNKIKGAEILKSDVLKKIAARREQLVKMMEALKKKETSLKEEKQGFADSISENLQSYAGFGSARGHTARDFVSWMRYRLGKMRTFASNVQKLKGMGLDPKLIREMLAGGIENAIPKVEALVKGGGGYISQINSLQKEIDGVVKSISTEQSTSLFADELASNKRRQDVVTKAMKDNEARLDKFRSGKDKVISMKSYTDLENKTSKYKYQAKPLPKKTTTKKTTTTVTSGKYKVKAGDSLWLIANKYKTTVDNLKKLNGLKSNLIHPNQTLKVPGATKSQKVVNLEAAKKKREDESTKLIVNTAKKLNVVGKNDKYAAELKKELAEIKKTATKKDDALVAKLEKELKAMNANTKKLDRLDEAVMLLAQILNKSTDVILDGQKVSKTVEKNIVTKARTTARKTVTPKPKTAVRRKA
ncbi:phage tail tape measure protein [Macrococcus epidermidis]|uniref:lysostaphin n=1 Tax=Macrococcus epidermidis TaxID=1902580 RepID=A0A327ZRZ9_9STAP|nr:phage tail tape measure protein [Macrococcus epidermidis]RAK45009.1 phage tail tape measure protein [Macrococcus epidermidis]